MRLSLFASTVVLAALALSACGDDTGSCGDGARCLDARTGDAHAGDARADSAPLDAASMVVSLDIEPQNPTLTSRDGAAATQQFQVYAVRADGTRLALTNGTWSTDSPRLGTVDGNGLFTANGAGAGTVALQVQAPVGTATLNASTTITVRVEREIVGPGAPADSAARFMAGHVTADPTHAAQLLYPLDNAVMPNNVAPPDVQWQNGVAGDLYRVRLSKLNATVTAYVIHSGAAFAYDWLVDRGAWSALLASDPAVSLSVAVDRLEASTSNVYTGAPITVNVAQGSVFGAVYYWDITSTSGLAGRALRIDPVTGARDNFMPNPPSGCTACHTISRNGHYLSAGGIAGSNEYAYVVDLTADLSGANPPTQFTETSNGYLFSTFNPDASRVLVTDSSRFSLLDARTGAAVAATGLPDSNVSHPEWSPDDHTVAFALWSTGSYAVDFTAANIAVMDHTGGDAFANVRLLHSGASLGSAPEGGACDSHPSYSPGVPAPRFLAFQHGQGSTSARAGADSTGFVPSSVYLMGADGSNPVRLDRAVGGATARYAYWPTFSPFVTTEPGGRELYWLAFYSVRDYGNAQAGTQGHHRRQLWVTAIDVNAAAGGDPSSVPYWLPGQDVTSENAAAYWAPSACRGNSETCNSSSECCSGTCLPDPSMPGRMTCQPPPTSQCHHDGQTCSSDGDCCMGLTCFGNVCGRPPG